MPPLIKAAANLKNAPESGGIAARFFGRLPEKHSFSAHRAAQPQKRCLSCHAGAAAFHYSLHVRETRHCRIARRRHRKRPVGGAAIYGVLRRFAAQETVDQARRERIAAAYPIENLEIGT